MFKSRRGAGTFLIKVKKEVFVLCVTVQLDIPCECFLGWLAAQLIKFITIQRLEPKKNHG